MNLGASNNFIIKNEWPSSRMAMLFFVFVILFLVYSSAIYLPYLLSDENWLLRGWDSDPVYTYPSLRFLVGLVQGRPIFLAMLYISRGIVYVSSQTTAIQLLRLFSIFGMSIFVMQMITLSSRIHLPYRFSVPIALTAVTLPSFQVMVGNATWLVLPIILVAWGFLITFDSVINEHKKQRKIVDIVATIILFGLSLATYQSCILVNFSLLIFVLLFGYQSISTTSLIRLFLHISLLALSSVMIYYILWRTSYYILLGSFTENRYSPQNISIAYLAEHLQFFIHFRLRQGLNLWMINTASKAYLISVLVIALGFFSCLWHQYSQNKQQLLSSLKVTLFLVGASAAAIVASDLVAMSAPGRINSFTTVTALALTCYFIFIWSLVAITTAIGVVTKLGNVFSLIILCFLNFTLVVYAQYSVLTHFSLPNWLLTKMVEDTVSGVQKTGKSIARIVIYKASRPLNDFYSDQTHENMNEFYWCNFSQSFYTYWHLKNILLDLGITNFPEVVFINNRSDKDDSNIKLLKNPKYQAKEMLKQFDFNDTSNVIVMRNIHAPNSGATIVFDFGKNALDKSTIILR